jgi:hypothetical protein
VIGKISVEDHFITPGGARQDFGTKERREAGVLVFRRANFEGFGAGRQRKCRKFTII